MREDARRDLVYDRRRAELHSPGISRDGSRVAGQSRAVRAAEGERIVSLNAMTLGAAFHGCGRTLLFRQVHPFQQILQTRVVADRIEHRVDFRPLKPGIMLLYCLVQLGKGLIFLAHCAIDRRHEAGNYILRFRYFL